MEYPPYIINLGRKNKEIRMKFSVSERYNAVVITLSGNVMGGDESVEFLDAIKKFIESGKKNIVINLGEVKFLNSSGLGMLISAHTTVTKAEGKLKLSNIGDKIENLLVITKLITIFEVHETVEKAVESFA